MIVCSLTWSTRSRICCATSSRTGCATSTSSATSKKTVARTTIERLRELANDNSKPINLYINSAGGNVTDGLALHDAIQAAGRGGVQVSDHRAGDGLFDGVGRPSGGKPRPAPVVSALLDHDPRARQVGGLAIDNAAAQHLDRLKQMQNQIYQIMSARSGRSLKQIIRDTRRVDFYLDAWRGEGVRPHRRGDRRRHAAGCRQPRR